MSWLTLHIGTWGDPTQLPHWVAQYQWQFMKLTCLVSAQTRDIWAGQNFLRFVTDRNLGEGFWESCTYEDEFYESSLSLTTSECFSWSKEQHNRESVNVTGSKGMGDLSEKLIESIDCFLSFSKAGVTSLLREGYMDKVSTSAWQNCWPNNIQLQQ